MKVEKCGFSVDPLFLPGLVERSPKEIFSWDFKNNVVMGDKVHMHATIETGPFE